MSAPSFETQLAAFRLLVQAGKQEEEAFPPPTHVGDQMAAAEADALEIVRRTESANPGLTGTEVDCAELDPEWFDEMNARILTALAGCRPCLHLRASGPQPAVARLALGAVRCGPCDTVQYGPPEDADRCDWCHAKGVTQFTPVGLQRGPAIVAGDACDDCVPHLILPQLREAS